MAEGGDDARTGRGKTRDSKEQSREERLAQALRDNLRRRKAKKDRDIG